MYEASIKNPTIEVIGKYINSDTKIMHHCLTHDVYWETKPSTILRGSGCEFCRKEKFHKTRTKTHQKYLQEVEKINPNIEVVENYIDAKTPIKHHCKKHDIYWMAYPDGILKGCGCIECGKEKIGDKNSKKYEQYIEELKKINPNIIPIGKYVNSSTPILHKCLLDRYEWLATPSSILFGNGCPKCAGNIKRTHDEYIKDVKLINPNIVVVGEYIDARTPILHRCKIHNIEWLARPYSILNGCGCIECGKEKQTLRRRKSQKQYIKEVNEINSNIIVLGNYINSNTPILHKCLIDNYEWYTTPGNILAGSGCPKCAGKIQKTHDEYINEISMVNPEIEVVGQYINSTTPILHRCLIDGYEWNAVPYSILNGSGCPRCHESSGERKVRQWLDKHKIKYIYQKVFISCRDIKPLPFDFYLPNSNICIEYDGGQHFKPVKHFGGLDVFNRTIKHDKIKNEYCKNNGISLLRIPYFKDVEEELNNFLFI